MSQNHPGTVKSVVVSDAAAVTACCQFADDQRCMVEPACGAALAGAAYDAEGVMMGVAKLLKKSKTKDEEEEEKKKKIMEDGETQLQDVVVIACGGNIVTRSMMEDWSKKTK